MKRRGRRLCVALVASLVCLFLLDVAVHLFVVRAHWRPIPPLEALTNERQRAWLERRLDALEAGRAGELARFDPQLGWTLRADALLPGARTRTNSRGWRGAREYADAAPPGVTRIVCAGDSFTFCQEVGDEDAWPHLLEERLGEDAEVVNLGVGGYGTDQALLRFEREYPRAPVDVVLAGLLLENVGRNVNRYRPRWYPRAASAVGKPRFVERDGELELVPLPYAHERELLDAVATGSVLADLAADEYWLDGDVSAPLSWSGLFRLLAGRRFYAARELDRLWSDVDGEPFRVTTGILREFRERAHDPEGHAAGLFAVLVFPTRADLAGFRETGTRYWQPLLDWLAVEGIPTVDLTEALAAAADARRPGDPGLWGASHLSPAGNAVVAGTLQAFLATSR